MWVDLNNYIYTLKGIKKASDLKKDDLIRNSEKVIKIESLKYQKNVKTTIITLSDNSKIYLHPDTIVKLSSNRKTKVSNLKIKDYIKHSSFNYFNNKEGDLINWENDIKYSAYPIKIPEENNHSFCEWIGLFMAIGIKNKTTGLVAIEITNREFISDYYIKLTKKVFNITPLIREQENRVYLEFYSKNLVNFLKINTGYKFKFRKIPSFLYSSSVNEIISFIKGLSLKGYYSDKKQNIIYNGSSIVLAEFIQYFLKSIGYYSKILIRKKENYKTYNLIITSKHKNSIFKLETLNPKLRLESIQEKFLVKISDNFYNYKISAKNTNRSYIRKVREEKRLLIHASALRTLEDNPLLFDYYYLSIKNIEFKERDMVFIKTVNDDYLEVNNILLKY